MFRCLPTILVFGVLVASDLFAATFVDNKDMNNGRLDNLIATENVQVYDEIVTKSTKYWSATSSGTGSVTYGYTFSEPIQSASFFANLLTFRSGDQVWLDVSRDGTTFTNIFSAVYPNRLHPTNSSDPVNAGPPPSFDLTSDLQGSYSAFIRARMSGVEGAQFMRTADDIPGFNAPNVYQFSAVTAVPEPSTCAMALAGLVCGGYSMFRRRRAR
jgi:hypothetical protein